MLKVEYIRHICIVGVCTKVYKRDIVLHSQMHAPSDKIDENQGFSSDLMLYALEREHDHQKDVLWRRARALSKNFQTAVDESMFSKSLRTAGRAFCDDVVVGTTTLVPVVRNAGIQRMLETENLAELTTGLYEYLYDEATQVSILLFLAKYITTPQPHPHDDVTRLPALMSAARFHRTITRIMRVHTNHRRLQRSGTAILSILSLPGIGFWYILSPDETRLTENFAGYVVDTIAFAMQNFPKDRRIQRSGLHAISNIVARINQTFKNSYIFTGKRQINLLTILAECLTSQGNYPWILEEFANLCSILMGRNVHMDCFYNRMCARDACEVLDEGEKEFMNFIPIAENLMLNSMESDARTTEFERISKIRGSMVWKGTSSETAVVCLLLKIERTYPGRLRQVDRIIKCVTDTFRYYPLSNDHLTGAINLLSVFLFQSTQRFPKQRYRTTAMQNTVFSSGIIKAIGKLVLNMPFSVFSCATCVKFLQLICDVCRNNPSNHLKIIESNIIPLLIDLYAPRILGNSWDHPIAGNIFVDARFADVKLRIATTEAWTHVLGLLDECGVA